MKPIKRTIKYALVAVSLGSVIACFHQNTAPVCDSYTGILPAASSVGIETTINLLETNRYHQKDVYIGEKDGVFHQNGTYTIDRDMLTLRNEDGSETYYHLEDEQIRMLGQNKKTVTGSLADFYILKCVKR